MVAIEDESFEEREDDPFPSSKTAPELKPLPSMLKYAFLDHHCANPVIILAARSGPRGETIGGLARKEGSNQMEFVGP